MAKPGTLPGTIKRPTIETQTHIAHAELKLKWYRLGQPWICGIGLLILAAAGRAFAPGIGTAALAGLCGLLIAVFDFRLRSSRIHWEARMIGPITVLSSTAWLSYTIAAGFSKSQFLTWVAGWVLTSIIWDIWLAAGEHKDENRQFPVAAANAGLGGAWFSGLRRREGDGRKHWLSRRKHADVAAAQGSAAGRAGGLIGTMHLPPGEITPANAAAKIENLEGAMGHPPGSWSLAPDPENAANTQVKISDPAILNNSLPWPYGMTGSNPGASIAHPLSLGLWQDGALMEYCLLRHHMLYVGLTDSGKTMTAAYNIIGEAISRCDYACLAIDLGKGNQFMGALRPALHGLATTPEEALKLLNAIHRMRSARAEFLASRHQTEWSPGCGLTFLDFWFEEVADLADMIVNREFGGSKEQQEQWKSDLRAYRSVGGRFDMSTQRSDFQEIPTMIRSQMGKACFGVNSRAEAELGLSDEQKKRGCRPELWQAKVPGKFHIDAPSIPDDRIGMPARGWFWGSDAILMAAYAQAHPISARPLDDVTGGALEAEPGPSPTSTYPIAGADPDDVQPVATGRPHLHLATVRDLPSVSQQQPVKMTPQQSFEALRNEVESMRRRGITVFRRSTLKPLIERLGKTTQWLDAPLQRLEEEKMVKKVERKVGQSVTRWEILPQVDTEVQE